MNECKYLYDGTYHTDTSAEYMSALGIDAETQESIVNQQAFEAEQGKIKKIDIAKAYLFETDWIISKMAEANLNGVDISALATKYSVELTEREAARTLINTLEQEA